MTELPAVLDERGLTGPQRVFVDAFLGGMTATAAARAAGYSDPDAQAYRIMKSPAVSRAIAAGRAATAERVKVTRDDVLQGFLDAARAAGNATELVMAWRELGKMQGYYMPEEKKITIDKPGAARRSQLEALPEAELIKMVGIDPAIIDAEYTMLPPSEDDAAEDEGDGADV